MDDEFKEQVDVISKEISEVLNKHKSPVNVGLCALAEIYATTCFTSSLSQFDAINSFVSSLKDVYRAFEEQPNE